MDMHTESDTDSGTEESSFVGARSTHGAFSRDGLRSIGEAHPPLRPFRQTTGSSTRHSIRRPPDLLFNSNTHPNFEEFPDTRFLLPLVRAARQNSSLKSPGFPFNHLPTRESNVLPPLFIPAAGTNLVPRETYPRPQGHHHIFGDIPLIPRRLPFRTGPPQELPSQRATPIIKGSWDALLDVASAEIQAQPPAVPDTKPEQSTAVKPRWQGCLPVKPAPPRETVLRGCTTSRTLERNSIPVNRIDPNIAKESRPRRRSARRKAAKLKRLREANGELGDLPLPQEPVPVASSVPVNPNNTENRHDDDPRRLSNRVSVQKCRNREKIRCKKLHAERDRLAEETKILKKLRDEIHASGVLKLKVATAITTDDQESLQNNEVSGAESISPRRNKPLLNSTSGHAFHSNANSGAIPTRLRYTHGNIEHSNERSIHSASTQKDGRTSMYLPREVIGNQELPVTRTAARENDFNDRDAPRFRSRALPILPDVRKFPWKDRRSAVSPTNN